MAYLFFCRFDRRHNTHHNIILRLSFTVTIIENCECPRYIMWELYRTKPSYRQQGPVTKSFAKLPEISWARNANILRKSRCVSVQCSGIHRSGLDEKFKEVIQFNWSDGNYNWYGQNRTNAMSYSTLILYIHRKFVGNRGRRLPH